MLKDWWDGEKEIESTLPQVLSRNLFTVSYTQIFKKYLQNLFNISKFCSFACVFIKTCHMVFVCLFILREIILLWLI